MRKSGAIQQYLDLLERRLPASAWRVGALAEIEDHLRCAAQIPPIAGDVEEHGDPPVGLRARRAQELDAGGRQPLANALEVVDAEEESDAPGHLVPDGRRLALPVGAGEQDARLGAGRPDDDPPLRAPVVRQRGRVLDQLEAQDPDEELDGRFVVVDDDRDEVDPHRALPAVRISVPGRQGDDVARARRPAPAYDRHHRA